MQQVGAVNSAVPALHASFPQDPQGNQVPCVMPTAFSGLWTIELLPEALKGQGPSALLRQSCGGQAGTGVATLGLECGRTSGSGLLGSSGSRLLSVY